MPPRSKPGQIHMSNQRKTMAGARMLADDTPVQSYLRSKGAAGDACLLELLQDDIHPGRLLHVARHEVARCRRCGE